MNKKWEICECNEDLVKKIEEETGVSELLATLLVNRGITNKEEIDIFLEPTRDDFHDPFLMPDMKQAVDRLQKAIETNEKIIIYGDYDVDCITSIAVLKQFLEDRGMEVGYHIPNRLDQGYGLNKDAIDENKVFENLVK